MISVKVHASQSPTELRQLAAGRDAVSRCGCVPASTSTSLVSGTEGRPDPERECGVYLMHPTLVMYISVKSSFKRHLFITELFRQTD